MNTDPTKSTKRNRVADATPNPDDHLTAAQLKRLNEAWERFVVAVRRTRARTGGFEDGLSLSQYELIKPLTSGQKPIGRLAEGVGIAPATATQILDGLERDGAVQRSRTAADRRTVHVTLTERGRRALERKRRGLVNQRRRLFENLEPEERGQAERVLRHLAEIMDEL
jgi:MarR family transcriptional regulator, organic hydroperoxide resistance regulator